MPWFTKLDAIFFLSAIFGLIAYMVVDYLITITKRMNNMAPDKIYIHEASAPELALPLKEYHIEYIRKDALLEWAEECKKQLKSEDAATIKDDICYGADAAFDSCIYLVDRERLEEL